MRHAIIGAALVAAVAGRFVIVSAGQAARCTPSGGLSFICGVQNPEDLVQVPNTRWLVAGGMAPGSGLHIVDTRAKTVRNLYAAGASTVRADKTRYASCPGPLDPKQAVLHGLSLRTGSNGRFTVYATNHGGRESIEVFELDASGPAPTAVWTGCVLMPDKMAANSVASFSDGSLVATVLIMPGKTFEDAFAGRTTGAVFLWTPGTASFRQLPGTQLSANNGIETSPDDREFFVVSTTTKRIVAFSRSDPSKPLRTAQLKEFGPDNVRWTSANRLITAGMIDNEPACGGPPKTEAGIRCSRGYIAATIDPTTMAVTEIARGPATPAFTGTSIALRVGDELWLGSFNADRIAYRSLR
ncbi:MAG TPA: SMP-30/gluconolactonase/LRE family protein [Vicinamibacterales bacterium]|nr:SMP-30/gluconolactonase/LRE family protein [Vicinamibacterales bacterium]